MTFDDLCKRLTDLGGEQVEESAAEKLEGVDLTELKECGFSKTACFVLPLDRSYHELKAIAYTACRMLVVCVFEYGGEADFALFGVPYLEFSYAEIARAAILK